MNEKVRKMDDKNEFGIKPPKRKIKDSLFTKMFREKKYVLRLYKDLHPEDTSVTEDDIDICTLETVFVNSWYNDLGFTVSKRFILLIEAQSDWDKNITIRILIYLVRSYVNYINASGQNLHQKTKLKLPIPEVYVIYTGNRKIPEDELSLSKTFFDGKDALDLKIKVLDKKDASIYGQYIAFCRTLDEQRAICNGDFVKAVNETLRICIENDILAEYINMHKQEVYDMTLDLFDQDKLMEDYLNYQQKQWYKEGEEKGEERGIKKGREEGRKDLMRKMRARGYTEEQIADLLA